MKESMDQVTKLIENWAEDSFIVGVIDKNGNNITEYYEDIKEWIHPLGL